MAVLLHRSRVCVHVLSARPELNDRVGVTVCYVAEKNLWEVRLDDEQDVGVLISAHHLRVLQWCKNDSVNQQACTEKFAVVAMEGKGFGIVATAQISQGERVLIPLWEE